MERNVAKENVKSHRAKRSVKSTSISSKVPHHARMKVLSQKQELMKVVNNTVQQQRSSVQQRPPPS